MAATERSPTRPGRTCISTTTLATTSIGCGWIGTWSTRAAIFRRQTAPWKTRRSPRWISSAGSCISQPGERVIEAGCGWGSLALFMAKRYGVTVKALNISSEQIAYARARAKDEGLDARVEFVEDDYRNVRDRCDVFVSVGMLEHVGLADLRTLGEVVGRCLDSRGRGLLHFIGRNQPTLAESVDPQAHLPRRLSSDAARGLRARARTARVLGARRRESPAALRQDARALASAVRRRLRSGAGDVRRDVRSRVAVVSGRFGSGIHDRHRCSCSRSCSRAARATRFRGRDRPALVCTPAELRMESCDVRRRRRRPGRLVVRAERFATQASTSSSWIARCSRATRCAPDGSRRRSIDELDLDIDDYRRGRTFQPITGFRTGVIGSARRRDGLRRPVSYGIRRCEFDHYLLQRSGADVRQGRR